MRATISRRPLVLGCLSLLAGLAALVVGGVAVSAAQRAARTGFEKAPVAARALPEGTLLTEVDIRYVALPPDALPAGLASEVAGHTVTLPLLAGDFILAGKLAPSGRGVSALLLAGEVAAPVEPAAGVTVAVGERVRVTATYDPSRYAGDDLVKVVAPAARVIALEAKGNSLVLALSPSERDKLALAAATARLDVAVLAPGQPGG